MLDDEEWYEEAARPIFEIFKTTPGGVFVISPDVFWYKVIGPNQSNDRSLWLLVFYRRVVFIGSTVPADEKATVLEKLYARWKNQNATRLITDPVEFP